MVALGLAGGWSASGRKGSRRQAKLRATNELVELQSVGCLRSWWSEAAFASLVTDRYRRRLIQGRRWWLQLSPRLELRPATSAEGARVTPEVLT